jgi:hypothetical protein
VREHQFLLATDGVAYDFFRVRGVANILFGARTPGRGGAGHPGCPGLLPQARREALKAQHGNVQRIAQPHVLGMNGPA